MDWPQLEIDSGVAEKAKEKKEKGKMGIDGQGFGKLEKEREIFDGGTVEREKMIEIQGEV